METVIRNIRDLNQTDRFALERVVGHQLGEGQRLVIQVVSVSIEETATPESVTNGELPGWCDIYAGLSEKEVDALDCSITRSPSSRDFS